MKMCKTEADVRDIINRGGKLDWDAILIGVKLSEDFIREFKNRVNWRYVSSNQKLSEDFIREFQNKVDWVNVSIFQKLSEDFIREFQNEVDWEYICKFQKLSENFINEFRCQVHWEHICIYQKLSENFIREFRYQVDWYYIRRFQRLSENFINEFNLKIYEDDWLYKDTEFKKKQIIELGLYECHDDHFIAYKSIRNDRYSFFNFQYQYLTGETYECHCDTTKECDSFGLSAWTQDGAMGYSNNGIIVRVKIKYEDVGRIVHKGGKLRCSKFVVLD